MVIYYLNNKNRGCFPVWATVHCVLIPCGLWQCQPGFTLTIVRSLCGWQGGFLVFHLVFCFLFFFSCGLRGKLKGAISWSQLLAAVRARCSAPARVQVVDPRRGRGAVVLWFLCAMVWVTSSVFLSRGER